MPGVLDAGAGLIAMLVFAIGTVVLGGIDSWTSIRVLELPTVGV